jgi:TPR repeat protein
MLYTRILRLLALSLLPLLLVAPVRAERAKDYAAELGPAYARLDQRDYARAYPLFQRKAASNPLAQFTLGLFHQNGWGRPVDTDAACAWFAKAALRRIPSAQHLHGDCLMRTPDAPGNAEAALASYLDAAKGSHYISLCSAAELLIHGRGVPRDVPRGLALCTQGAQSNAPPAMLRLALFLSDDAAVPPDLPQARGWFERAAKAGLTDARFRLAIMQSQGDGGEVDRDAALLGMESLAAEGHVAAYLPTAVLYANQPPQADTGALGAADLAKAYLWASAAKASLRDPARLASTEQLLASVLAIMPPEWRPELDRKVDVHLAKFAATTNPSAPSTAAPPPLSRAHPASPGA